MFRRTLGVTLAGVMGAGCGGSEENCEPFCTGGTSSATAPTTMAPTGSDTDTDTEGMSGTGDSGSTSQSDPTTGPEPTTGSDTDPGTGTDTEGETDPGTTGGLQVVPCIGLNILFVVDNSVGMAEEQARLRATAFAFVAQVAQQAISAMGNVSVGVITTDEPEFVVPTGKMSMPYSSGLNYMRWDPMSVDGNATVQAELDQALMVGEGGDPNERPMDMLLEALTGDTADGFNADFVEEDALLVVVLVSDEEDDIEQPTLWGSEGEPNEWVDTLAALKDGILRDIVVLSVIPDDSAMGCADDTDAPRLEEFTTAFPTSDVFDVCQLDYSAFLLSQVQPVVDACNEFSPP